MHNKLAALVVLGKYLGMFDERPQNSNLRPNGFNRLQEIKTMTVYVIADIKVLLEFPSAEAVKAFATDPKYAPHAAARQAGSESRFHLIDDTDVAGTIPYLPKG